MARISLAIWRDRHTAPRRILIKILRNSLEYVRGVADRLDSYASDLRDQSIDQLVGAALTYTRRQPAVVFGLAALAGFFALRTIKSTPPKQAAHATVGHCHKREGSMAADRLRDSMLPNAFSNVLSDIADLFQKELQLAKAELSSRLATKLRGGVWMLVAAALLLLAGAVFSRSLLVIMDFTDLRHRASHPHVFS